MAGVARVWERNQFAYELRKINMFLLAEDRLGVGGGNGRDKIFAFNDWAASVQTSGPGKSNEGGKQRDKRRKDTVPLARPTHLLLVALPDILFEGMASCRAALYKCTYCIHTLYIHNIWRCASTADWHRRL